MELNITHFFNSAAMMDYSASAAEIGADAGASTWDNPKTIAGAAFKNGAEKVCFRKTENSQFYVRFECWISK